MKMNRKTIALKKENALLSSNEIVTMQTAITKIKNTVEKIQTNVRVLLGSGSQITYISKKLAQKLKVIKEFDQEIHLVTFGYKKIKGD